MLSAPRSSLHAPARPEAPGPGQSRGPVCSRAGRSVLVDQVLTVPVFLSPAGTGPAYTTDPLLSLVLLALHKLLGQLAGQ